jgi:hypothetical protein
MRLMRESETVIYYCMESKVRSDQVQVAGPDDNDIQTWVRGT